MFGEYALFCQGKLVALVCDDQLFVKPTAEGRAYAEPVTEAPPYPSAKPCLVIDGDRWDDRNWLAGLFAISAANLLTPAPKKRRPK
ncbi:MAG: TfoX/Sxy family protein [Beijerinckiaceae bacterium]|nr:TfoX/Sxy family protein [Beijerinckiaceae bacterium]